MKRGALIVLEGCDRAGKSTQCKKLVEALNQKGVTAEPVRFPDRSTVIGKMIGSYLEKKSELQDNAIHLLFSANRWEMVPYMEKQLHKGTTLVVDRYAYSGVAFTAAKDGFDLHWCKQSDVGLPKPDLVFFLEVKPEEAEKRDDFGDERYESTAFQVKVKNNFDLLKEESWRVLDASQSIDDLHQQILEIAENTICGDLPKQIDNLWVT
ncbi:thymidylate kinase-like [Asterias rubens]|uniref:thymidylate kinase-like n=1 Tax=Asterias rubens TaxID=7604 RepID=UPI001454EB2C|nr:thymidylate kinase-like [Asterias rubens]